MPNPLWFKEAVIYQLHVKTFQDSDGDGVGDFTGLLQRLDYLAELGVTAIWIMPFYPSPLRDDGYDIADYLSVHPSYGTLEQVEALLEAAHARGLRVITELVLNHTSDQHPWFQRARRAAVGSPERDYYVWSDTTDRYQDARIIFQDFEQSNWTWDPVAKAYFWHRFYSHQPDLNFDNPVVHEELLRVIDFWLARGVDGVRLDAVPYLYEREGTNCENLPETHAFLRKLRAHIDSKYTDRMLLAEANQWPEDAAQYFGAGDECHMNFNFPLMPRLFMALQMEDRHPIIDILEQTPAIPDNCQWAIFLRNHDELTLEMVTDEERDYMVRVYATDPRARINLGIRRRLAPLLGNNRRKIELINSLLFSLPGTPIIYYGDEIGMGDNFYLGDRNGVRTPMQWTPDRNAGFSRANPQQLYLPAIIDPEYHYESVNVENEQRNVSSQYWWMRRMLAVRQRTTAFVRGTIEFIQPDNAKVLAYVRRDGDESILVVANLSRFVQVAELDLSAFAGLVPEELFGHSVFPQIPKTPATIALGPHGFYWLALKPATRTLSTQWSAPRLTGAARWDAAFIRKMEREILPGFLPGCRWFGGKGRVVRELHVTDQMPIGGEEKGTRLIFVEVAYTEGVPDCYTLVLTLADEATSTHLSTETPHAIIAHFEDGHALCDGLYLPEVRANLLRLIATPGKGDRLRGRLSSPLPEAELERALGSSRLIQVDQSNSSIAYGDRWLFKLYRKFERGSHPDVEVTKFLTEERKFTGVPAFVGALKVEDGRGEGVTGLLVALTQNQGDGWTFTVDAVSRYFDRVLEARVEHTATTATELIGGVYPERARQLGERTAELHLALASGTGRADFAPEPFSTLYQRSLYQAMRGSAGRVLRQLRHELPSLSEAQRADAEKVCGSESEANGRFAGLLRRKIDAVKIRVHGDFHLGQVLNTGKDFVIIDFEGEPRRPLGERSLKRSPLVDVAGMLRSFDYAAAAALALESASDAARLAAWRGPWVEAAARSYLSGYLSIAREGHFLPLDPADGRLLLEAFLLNKAIYEVGYELSYRPDFLEIPMQAVLRLLAGPSPELEAWTSIA